MAESYKAKVNNDLSGQAMQVYRGKGWSLAEDNSKHHKTKCVGTSGTLHMFIEDNIPLPPYTQTHTSDSTGL